MNGTEIYMITNYDIGSSTDVAQVNRVGRVEVITNLTPNVHTTDNIVTTKEKF
jgi:hypothetical protein